MKPEEAIEDIRKCIQPSVGGKSLQMAIEALEKQVPKRPQLESYGYSDGESVYDEWFCPKCGEGYEIDSHDYNYCPECGQCIDRSEIDET